MSTGFALFTEMENLILTRTGPATPMGDLLRRLRLPALRADEVGEADGAPVRLKLLSEDLNLPGIVAGQGLLAKEAGDQFDNQIRRFILQIIGWI